MARRWICVKECFYQGALFQPGDLLPSGWTPGAHFELREVPLPRPWRRGEDHRITVSAEDPPAEEEDHQVEVKEPEKVSAPKRSTVLKGEIAY